MRLGYIVFGPGGKQVEVYAASSYAAQQEGARLLGVPAKKAWKCSPVLCEKDGVPVVHKPQDVCP